MKTALLSEPMKPSDAERLQALETRLLEIEGYRKSGVCSWCGALFKVAPFASEEECQAGRAKLLEHARNCKGHPAVREVEHQSTVIDGLVEALRNDYETFTQVAMLIDGWNAPEAEWSEWDRQIRQMVTDRMTQATAALAQAKGVSIEES